ncbi:hypothetical protein [Listeria booriae]|uniref:Uncharacterized protein n=1 Tax=Listeria booriae TaxID=1552123 RepID=A0A7X0XCB7_9LIST|nr:hypothetical protein [Listeria booriae]MBC1491019.1 hypothetical protein [Listeria booriae]MBC1491066.1 hypothetical protein [Listeria booriae]MBC2293000.1 hypothetical protein [Listeria booriae]MBC2676291.1 hypothetical protein [Listeria booriae]MBC6151101.1 hypothetical protein [Listeria booriae]
MKADRNKEVNICFSQYDNESLRIDLASATFDLIISCTTETNDDEFEEIPYFNESENNEIRTMHCHNLIASINCKNQRAIDALIENGIIHEKPLYKQKNGRQMLAYYKLTRYGIEQKCKIIDEEEFSPLTPSALKSICPSIDELDAETVYKKCFLYKRQLIRQ